MWFAGFESVHDQLGFIGGALSHLSSSVTCSYVEFKSGN